MKESVLSFKKPQHNFGLTTFKLLASTQNILRLTC